MVHKHHIDMSHKANDEWLAAANENFEEALEEENYPLAASIANDVYDAGFQKEAVTMRKSLNARSIE